MRIIDDAYHQRVERLYSRLADDIGDAFDDADRNDLRFVLQVTLEFAMYVEDFRLNETFEPSLGLVYACETIFSAIEFYQALLAGARVLAGALPSAFHVDEATPVWIRGEFLRQFEAFEREADTNRALRGLLDLFARQIVFAGLMYERADRLPAAD